MSRSTARTWWLICAARAVSSSVSGETITKARWRAARRACSCRERALLCREAQVLNEVRGAWRWRRRSAGGRFGCGSSSDSLSRLPRRRRRPIATARRLRGGGDESGHSALRRLIVSAATSRSACGLKTPASMVGDLDEGRGAEMTTQIELAIEPDVAEKQQVMTAGADRDGRLRSLRP